MEKDDVQKREQIAREVANQAKLISLVGGGIAILGGIADANILSNKPEADPVIWASAITLAGISLVLNGAVRYLRARDLISRIHKNRK